MQHEKIKFIASFDSVRGIAAIFVLLIHGSYGILKGGFIGVDLFFVLSGYLITTILHKEYITTGDISFSKFYARRALRLFPGLIVCVVLGNILWPYSKLGPADNQVLSTFATLFYFTNLIPSDTLGNTAHLWSLSVEEHFYLFWPLLMLFFVFRIPRKRSTLFLSFIVVLIVIMRLSLYPDIFNFGPISIVPRRFTFYRIDGMILGALLSLNMPKFNKDNQNKWAGTPAILGILLVFIVLLFTLSEVDVLFNKGGFVLTNLLCTLAVFIAVRYAENPLFANRILNWVGKRSYGIYIYHASIFLLSENFRVPHSAPNFIIVNVLRFAVSFAFAALSYKYVEQPILRYKRKFEA